MSLASATWDDTVISSASDSTVSSPELSEGRRERTGNIQIEYAVEVLAIADGGTLTGENTLETERNAERHLDAVQRFVSGPKLTARE